MKQNFLIHQLTNSGKCFPKAELSKSNNNHKAKQQLLPNDIVELLDKPRKEIKQQTEIKFKNFLIDLIYEDDYILVVEKPAKLLSVATNKLESDTLHSKCVDYLKQENEKSWAFIVHRLDRETSGVMILAKNKSAKEYLKNNFLKEAFIEFITP